MVSCPTAIREPVVSGLLLHLLLSWLLHHRPY
jgi:hypothetical protein